MDVGSLEDDHVSLSESLTDHQSTVADAPPKIPIQGIRERLIKVNQGFINLYWLIETKFPDEDRINTRTVSRC